MENAGKKLDKRVSGTVGAAAALRGKESVAVAARMERLKRLHYVNVVTIVWQGEKMRIVA